MLKHKDLIEKLDPLQKVALVASALESGPFEQAGIPALRRVGLDALADADGVSYGCAVRSWNPELLERMTEELVSEAKRNGARFVVAPDLKTATDPRGNGLSEDPYLNGTMGAAVVRAAHASGAGVGLGRLSVSPAEIAYLDRREDAGAVHDLVVKPFLQATKEEPCDAIFCDPSRVGKGYYDTNRALFKAISDGMFGKDVIAVGEGETSAADAVKLLRGKVTLGGSAIPLERAVRRYRQLARFEQEGSVPHRDLEDSIRDGSALDEETLDKAADEVIDFVLRFADPAPALPETDVPSADAEAPREENEELVPEAPVFAPIPDDARRRMAAESVVLLKNEKLLPLRRGAKIAVLGEAYSDLSALEETFEIVGRAEGYDRDEARSDALVPEAVRATNRADAALLFLHPDATGRELALPANRIALLDALNKAGKPVIALVCGDLPVDMRFDGGAAATLLVPGDGPFAGDALARVLCGAVNPSGKLARTAYDDADAYFETYRANRDAGRMRIGSFVGYRRYDTAGETVRYPFGYGIGYSKFVYSNLRVEKESVSFTLRNGGKFDGSEIAQVYVGAPSGSRVTPAKQLRAFRKVYLRAGESKQVVIPMPAECYETFDSRLYADNVEAGVYRVYVGASSLDIRLQGKRTLEGVARDPLPEKPADYFPDGEYADVAEIGREDRMSKNVDRAPKRLKLLRRAAIFALPAAAVLFFLLLSTLILSYTLDYALLSAVEEQTATWILYGLAVLMIAALPLLVGLNRRRVVRMRNAALFLLPFLFFACFILGILLLYAGGGELERVILRVVSCLAVGVPLLAVAAVLIDRDLRKSGGGVNHWEKYYFERERNETATPDPQFEEAFRAAEAARRARTPAPAEEPSEAIEEVPQFYDRRLTYDQLLRDCGRFLSDRGIAADDGTLRDWIAAISATQLVFVPAGCGATLCEGVAEYFGKKAYVDNAEEYRRYEDLFSRWKQSGRANVASGFSAALAAAKYETAFLHTVLIRHVDASLIETLFLPIADVLARRRAALPLPDGESVLFPPNLVLVAEIEGDRLPPLPGSVSEAAAALTPSYEPCDAAPRKTVVQAVGFERFQAMRLTVRDDYLLGEASWRNVDLLDSRCKSAHIGNRLWIKTELHASVVLACGGEAEEALDSALAAELMPWLAVAWNEETCGGPLCDALSEIFGEQNVVRSAAAAKGENRT